MVENNNFKLGDGLVCVAVAMVAFLLWWGSLLLFKQDAPKTLVVLVQGEVVLELPLTDETTLDYTIGDQEWNHFVVENGTVEMVAANCSGEDCVHSGKIQQIGQSIICLPHRVELRLVGSDNQGVDGVVR